jgi:putative hydrolase of the HAD superfamily
VRGVPLLLLDLDDTLLDRAAAFQAWGAQLLDRIGAPLEDLDWLRSIDADGLNSHWDLAEAVRDRYRLRISSLALVDTLRDGLASYLHLDPLVACALRVADAAGWLPVVVANGETEQQELKIKVTGLDQFVAEWVISEEAGVSKPNPRIFAIAAQRARLRLPGAWVVGDSPEADIGGAVSAGLRSVWLHRGRPWSEPRYEPTCTADGVIESISAILDFG